MNASQPSRRGRPGHSQSSVVAVAVETFNRHGYEATSMGMLADALGVSKSAIYHHVPSKLEILRLALDDALSALETAADDAEAAPPSAASVADLMRATVRVLIEKQSEVRLLLRLRGNSDVEREAIERRRAVDRRTAAVIEAAQAAGELRGDLEPRELARLMFGTVNSVVEWHRPGGRQSSEEVAETVVSLLMDGARQRA
ncbi:TetR/AcrR family transcriptional regulator [Falsarthrobacter nasiphocae]|uniref:AcrR family transcriptional regulator n=1 Tax=Falsarthrobacter nasiphocae TaxID=189863 RepID=A0AAE3YGQ5_9MICC|nr:TetR/AcrR family transcriptional regulator [Falsarthrobacter nasiphocae]MDR6892397.1 AcrR family transcriptional regulator [Falsarthrobacter nasiphocae]